MASRGRPRLSGKRAKNGRRVLGPLHDHGTDHIIALRARFAKYRGDPKADHHLSDPIGRAWAVGLLENDRIDPAVLRDAGRQYALAYWSEYHKLAPNVSNCAGDVRLGSWDGGRDRAGERFVALQNLLTAAGRNAYSAAQSLCVDPHWFPDANPAWLDRLIEDRLRHRKVLRTSETFTLRCAIDGLLALAGERSLIAA